MADRALPGGSQPPTVETPPRRGEGCVRQQPRSKRAGRRVGVGTTWGAPGRRLGGGRQTAHEAIRKAGLLPPGGQPERLREGAALAMRRVAALRPTVMHASSAAGARSGLGKPAASEIAAWRSWVMRKLSISASGRERGAALEDRQLPVVVESLERRGADARAVWNAALEQVSHDGVAVGFYPP